MMISEQNRTRNKKDIQNAGDVRDDTVKKKGHGINMEAALTMIVLFFAAVQISILVSSGLYLNYVTPRMKPYLYGLAVLLFVWAITTAGNLFVPRYRMQLSKPLCLMVPVLLLMIMPGKVEGSSLMKGTEAFSIQTFEKAETLGSGQRAGTETYDSSDSGNIPEQGTPEPYRSPDSENVSAQETSGAYSDPGSESVSEQEISAVLPGLDETAKTITIADEDYYDWMMEMDMNYQKYIGYTVRMQGFVYRDERVQSQGDCAVVRLSMWCCAADLTPMGFIVRSTGAAAFPDDSWVTVTGTFTVNQDETAVILDAAEINAAQEPEETFVYPTYY